MTQCQQDRRPKQAVGDMGRLLPKGAGKQVGKEASRAGDELCGIKCSPTSIKRFWCASRSRLAEAEDFRVRGAVQKTSRKWGRDGAGDQGDYTGAEKSTPGRRSSECKSPGVRVSMAGGGAVWRGIAGQARLSTSEQRGRQRWAQSLMGSHSECDERQLGVFEPVTCVAFPCTESPRWEEMDRGASVGQVMGKRRAHSQQAGPRAGGD